MDIFGDISSPPVRPNTTDTIGARPPPPIATAPLKGTKPADSLLGLDFFGGPAPQAAGKPSSTSTTPGIPPGPSRPDLKQSILSLYASAPKPQPSQQQEQQNQRQTSHGGMQSPPPTSAPNFVGLNDAFSGLSFSSPTSPPAPVPQQQPRSSIFNSFSNPMKASPGRSNAAPPQVTSPPLNGGSFFDSSPKPAPKTETTKSKPQSPKAASILSTTDTDFGDFSFASSPPKPSPAQPSKATSSSLFDMSGFASQISAPSKSAIPPVPATPPPTSVSSPFNLSAQPAPPRSNPAPAATPTTSTSSNTFSNISTADVWGSNDAWGSSEPAAPAASAPKTQTPASNSSGMDTMAWPSTTSTGIPLGGSTSRGPPKVAQDEDFGGWSSAAPIAPGQPTPSTNTATSKSSGGGFGGGDDLFSNVWG